MKVLEGGRAVDAAKMVQESEKQREILFVTVDTTMEQVLQSDAEGVRIIFEHEKGVFKVLDDETLKRLSHETKVAYSVSEALNAKHDPENDEMQQRIKIGEMRNRRSQFEREVHTTVQSSLATKKLQAYVGHGFSPFWARPDKIEQRLAQGYEIVANNEDVYAGVSATSKDVGAGHFEVRSKPAEPELVLMRVPNDVKAKIMDGKKELATRMQQGLETSGKREIIQAGGRPVDGRDDLPWQDRK
jgi:hypothetical protein